MLDPCLRRQRARETTVKPEERELIENGVEAYVLTFIIFSLVVCDVRPNSGRLLFSIVFHV